MSDVRSSRTTRAAKRPPNVCPQGRTPHIPLRVGEYACVVVGGGTGLRCLG